MLSGDGDVDSLSSDEKSDGEGKTDRMSSSSSSIASSTDTQEVRSLQRSAPPLEGTPQKGKESSRSRSVKQRSPECGVCVSVVQSSGSDPDGRREEPSDGAE